MPAIHRRSAMKVKGGRTRRKNRWCKSPSPLYTPQLTPAIVRRRPGAGYRHVLKASDVKRFIKLLPDWDELSVGLNAVFLAPGNSRCYGWFQRGVVAICAWTIEPAFHVGSPFYRDHEKVFEQCGVRHSPAYDGYDDYFCEFSDNSARAFLLLHVLLHELGHHHDCMTTKRKMRCGRGENYAEQYALAYANRIYDRYCDEFGAP